jgi:hypothetical protein
MNLDQFIITFKLKNNYQFNQSFNDKLWFWFLQLDYIWNYCNYKNKVIVLTNNFWNSACNITKLSGSSVTIPDQDRKFYVKIFT